MAFVMVYDSLVRRWQCQRRGLCCKGHTIPIDRVGLARMQRTLLAAADPRAARIDLEAQPSGDGWREVPRDPGGACMFLSPEQLCGYRMAYGTETLPTVCKKYPFIQLYTPTQLRVGISFTCPTALMLLAQQDALDVREEVDGEPPVDAITHLAAPDRDFTDLAGRPLTAEAFWIAHQRLADVFDAAGGSPTERLRAVAVAAGGTPVEPITLSARSWRVGPLDPELIAQLDPLGLPPGLLRVWSQGSGHEPPRMPSFTGDEDALLTRYLAHRLLAPAFYAARTDLAWLLALLYFSVARYRLDRWRGAPPLIALREVDMLLVHSSLPLGLLGDADTRPAWRALAALATAS